MPMYNFTSVYTSANNGTKGTRIKKQINTKVDKKRQNYNTGNTLVRSEFEEKNDKETGAIPNTRSLKNCVNYYC